MPHDVVVKFADEHAGKTREQLEPLLDAEVERFSAFMAALPDWKARGELRKDEKALIKSYLVARVTGKLDGV